MSRNHHKKTWTKPAMLAGALLLWAYLGMTGPEFERHGIPANAERATATWKYSDAGQR